MAIVLFQEQILRLAESLYLPPRFTRSSLRVFPEEEDYLLYLLKKKKNAHPLS
jgi:hypothetical protein